MRLCLAHRKHDLDERGEQARPLERQRRRRLRPADRRHRRLGASLREAQLGESRLRLPAEPARLPVRLLGGGEVALQPEELALAIAGEACRRIPCLHEAVARSTRLFERIRPRAVQLQDLGPVHEAAAGEGDHLRLLRPPVRERSRPLARAAHLVHLLAREDHPAVDDPGDDRRELLGGDRDHRLVEQREALLHAPAP